MSKEMRPGAGAVGSKATGGINGVRVGNTPAVIADLDEAPQRHTSGQGQVEFSSENFPVREHGKQSQTVSEPGQFEFSGTPTEDKHLQRERISNREEVKDAEIKSLKDKRFKNEKDQRKTSETLKKDVSNPRGQR